MSWSDQYGREILAPSAVGAVPYPAIQPHRLGFDPTGRRGIVGYQYSPEGRLHGVTVIAPDQSGGPGALNNEAIAWAEAHGWLPGLDSLALAWRVQTPADRASTQRAVDGAIASMGRDQPPELMDEIRASVYHAAEVTSAYGSRVVGSLNRAVGEPLRYLGAAVAGAAVGVVAHGAVSLYQRRRGELRDYGAPAVGGAAAGIVAEMIRRRWAR